MNKNIKLNLITIFTITLILITSTFTVYADNLSLNDISNHWAKEYITTLVNKGIINGYDDGTFKPDNTITVAEFTKLIVVAISDDVGNAKDIWYSNYVNKAKELNIIQEREFDNYDRNINRGEMARMVARATNEKVNNIEQYIDNIKDYNNIPEEYRNYVLKSYALGIITGYDDNTFRYKKSATRAEASTIIVRLIDKSKRETPKIINNEEQIIIDEKEVPVEAVEIIKPYYEVKTNLANIDGDNTSKYYNYLDEILIYYSPEGQAGYTNHTFSLTFYTLDDKEISVQYAGAMYGYDEKTYNAVKEVLKVFYPTGYEEAFKQIKNVAETKGFSGYSYIDNRKFGAKYFSERNSVCIYIGGEN